MKPAITLLVFLAWPFTAPAQDHANGAELHGQSCTGCHDTGVYTRQPRRVNSLPALGKQVRFCRDNLGTPWFDDEVDDVILYLNRDYYRF
ncbi:MAG: cytochrome c [Gammaproteobacteria bacterium]|nr:cytochrome c [Gammaproteobacteria bacterium]